ncbi:MAG: hypothetical protein AMXMBFR64_57950 [Myxococcales bacterium]
MKNTLALLTLLALAAPARADVCVDPRMLVLFDSSGSLGTKANASSNYNAAVDAVTSVVQSEGSHIAFGLLLFPSAPAAMQCQMSASLAVPFAPNNGAAFKSFFDGYAGPHGKSDTPMLQALSIVDKAVPGASGVGLLKKGDATGWAVLVTDGIQDCCADELVGSGWGWDTEPDCNKGEAYGTPNYFNQAELAQNVAQQITIVSNLKAQGINTFVVGFGSKVDPKALNDMAVAGGTPRVPGCAVGAAVGPCYYQADDKAQLAAALKAIAKTVNTELCNGIDDDCDGTIDGMTKECFAACGTGVQTCTNGAWSACPVVEPKAETCNGVDDNCDGKVDEFLIQDCSTACGTGYETCTNGAWSGCTAAQPATEQCNGKDDDCDGSTDEGCACTEGQVEACGESKGECEPGTRECIDGLWSDCTGGKGKTTETCNGKDDDCDGVVDGMEQSCNTACGSGSEKCVEGAWVGCDAPQPATEVCNGQDDDCDGSIDEALTKECETPCAIGTAICIEGKWRECTATAATNETCDGIDNDCDGTTDEDTDLPCATDCGSGVRQCTDGKLGECVITGPAVEDCDGLDNDCDGVADNGATCPNGLACICGGCAAAAHDGACEYGTLTDGFCVIDLCPGGKFCKEGVCTEGDPSAGGDGGASGPGFESDAGDTNFGPQASGDVDDTTVAGGCDCDQASPLGGRTAAGMTLVWLIALTLALRPFRRRAR